MNREDSDAGFTLVELLVVLVIMPLVVGAIAAAIIVSYQDSGLAQNRLTDSSNAQISSEYFIRDVQGARYVFAPDPGFTPSSQAPQPYPVCTGTHLDPTAGLLLALYRPPANTTDTEPATVSSSALSVAYWVTPGTNNQLQLVRYSCPQGGAMTTVVMSDNLTSPTQVSVLPAQFGDSAKTGWTPTTASTFVSSAFTFPVSSIPVVSTAGFASGPIGIRSTAGFQTLSCTVASPTTFTCPLTGSGKVQNGAQVSQQASISGISISVTQPGSGYTYSLQAVPRLWASRLAIGAFGPGAPNAAALVSLHDVSVTNGSTLSVTGSATVGADSGDQVSVDGSFTATGAINTNGTTNCTAGSNITAQTGSVPLCPPAVLPAPVPFDDPLATFLAGTVPTTAGPSFTGSSCSSAVLQPGTYNCPLTIGADATLAAGVYILTQGISVQPGVAVSMAPGSRDGALLYLSDGNATFGSGSTISITPLTAAQSLTATNSTSALQGVWLWQASADTNTATLGGTVHGGGTAYVPRATVELSNSTSASVGPIIANSISLGNGSVTVGGA